MLLKRSSITRSEELTVTISSSLASRLLATGRRLLASWVMISKVWMTSMTRASRRRIKGKLLRVAKSSFIWAHQPLIRAVNRKKRSLLWISSPQVAVGQLSQARPKLAEAPLQSRLVQVMTLVSSTKLLHLTMPKRARKRARMPMLERDKPKSERTRGRLTKRKLGSELRTSRLTIRTWTRASRL